MNIFFKEKITFRFPKDFLRQVAFYIHTDSLKMLSEL